MKFLGMNFTQSAECSKKGQIRVMCNMIPIDRHNFSDAGKENFYCCLAKFTCKFEAVQK